MRNKVAQFPTLNFYFWYLNMCHKGTN